MLRGWSPGECGWGCSQGDVQGSVLYPHEETQRDSVACFPNTAGDAPLGPVGACGLPALTPVCLTCDLLGYAGRCANSCQ